MSQYSHNTVDITNPNTTWTKLYNKVAKKSTVLDIGCSSGYFAKVLIDTKQCTVDGIELNKDDAKRAAKICRKVIVGSIEDAGTLRKITKKYDYIIFADVLEHLLDPANVLKQVSQHLKPQGKILLSVPNMGHISTALELLNGSFQYEETGLLDRTHLHFYTRESVLEMVEGSGLGLDELNFTSYDIPKDIIQDGLSLAGLSAQPKFYKNIEQHDLLLFQYVATLSSKRTGKKPLPSREVFKAIHQNDLDRKKMMDHIQALEKVNKELVEEISRKTKETEVLNTKLGKVIKKLYRTK